MFSRALKVNSCSADAWQRTSESPKPALRTAKGGSLLSAHCLSQISAQYQPSAEPFASLIMTVQSVTGGGALNLYRPAGGLYCSLTIIAPSGSAPLRPPLSQPTTCGE